MPRPANAIEAHPEASGFGGWVIEKTDLRRVAAPLPLVTRIEASRNQNLHPQHLTISQELPPRGLATQVWLRIIAIIQEDVLDRRFANLVSEVHKVVPDSSVAPVWILLFESNHQIDDLLGDLRSTGTLAILAAVVLLGDESAIPSQNGVRRLAFAASRVF
jgi:hypothetical protein